jgi:hypothetical protein
VASTTSPAGPPPPCAGSRGRRSKSAHTYSAANSAHPSASVQGRPAGAGPHLSSLESSATDRAELAHGSPPRWQGEHATSSVSRVWVDSAGGRSVVVAAAIFPSTPACWMLWRWTEERPAWPPRAEGKPRGVDSSQSGDKVIRAESREAGAESSGLTGASLLGARPSYTGGVRGLAAAVGETRPSPREGRHVLRKLRDRMSDERGFRLIGSAPTSFMRREPRD